MILNSISKSVLLMGFVTLVAMQGAAHAGERSESVYDCTASNGAMQDCAQQELDRQDALLQQSFRKLTGGLSKDKSFMGQSIRSRIVNAQQVWEKYREATCDVAGIGSWGGSGEGLLIIECKTDMAIERIEYLHRLPVNF